MSPTSLRGASSPRHQSYIIKSERQCTCGPGEINVKDPPTGLFVFMPVHSRGTSKNCSLPVMDNRARLLFSLDP
jgi:hypothetical protein